MLSQRGGCALTDAQISALLTALLDIHIPIHIPPITAAHTVGNTNTAVAVRNACDYRFGTYGNKAIDHSERRKHY